PCPARELDRRARAAMQRADGEHRAVSGVNTWQREPMIAGELPRDAWRRTQGHEGRVYVRGVARTMTSGNTQINDASRVGPLSGGRAGRGDRRDGASRP